MKPFRAPLAGLVVFALAFALAALPAPSRAEQPAAQPTVPPGEQVPTAPAPHAAPPSLAHTALGAVIEANGGRVPATGTQLAAALAKLGSFVQLPVTFSAVALHSGLSHPRVVIAMRPSTQPEMVTQVVGGVSGGWGGGGGGGTSRLVAGTPRALGFTPANVPYLEGRLFLAANTEAGEGGTPVVRTVEFISWNGRKQKFDFGVIEGMGGTPQAKMLDGARCFSCHKNRGPILGVSPWSNTAHNDLVRATSAPLFKFALRLDKDGKEDAKLGPRDDVIDGIKFLTSNGPEVDAAVRHGADVLRDRDRFRMLVRTAEGRNALVLLLGAITARGELDALDKKLKFDLNHLNLITFLQDAHAANKALAPSTLADFSPAGPLPQPGAMKSVGGPANPVAKYDALRAAGNPGLPSEHQPSNPKAFVRPPVAAPTNPSQLVSAVALARSIGLSEADRTFLAGALGEAVKSLNDPAPTPAALAKAVFTGGQFADVLKTGVLPERDDFKDRFVAGLVDELNGPRPSDRVWPDARWRVTFWQERSKYASAPRFDPAAAAENEVEVLPSHACLRCHDVRTGPKPAEFNPIPALAFDPFDEPARDTWVRTADRKRKIEVLGRLVKRLGADKDMPPADSTEAELFRAKDPAALNAARDWLDAELKKAKGN